jgi:hypothetical protein
LRADFFNIIDLAEFHAARRNAEANRRVQQ